MNAWDAAVALAEVVMAQVRLQTRMEALEASQTAFLASLAHPTEDRH